MFKSTWVCVFAVGCVVADPSSSTRVEIREHNALGVVAVTSEHTVANGERTFVLEGLDGNDNVVARFQQKVGHVADLNLDSDEVGTEQIIGIADAQWRAVTREVNVHTIGLLEQSQRFREFFTLDAVKAELATEQTFVEFSREPKQSERPLYTFACSTGDFMVNPIVSQCCGSWFEAYEGDPSSINNYVEFKLPSNDPKGHPNQIARRERSPYGACKGYSGGACSGTQCYYGPNGFTMPYFYTGTETWNVVDLWQYDDDSCGPQDGGDPDYPGDLQGTFTNNQGCPGGNDGAGLWDY